MISGAESHERIVMDTSAFSRFRAGHQGVFDLISTAELVWLPTLVIGELEAGFELGKRAKANRVMLEDFLAESFVSVLPVSISVSRIYGKIFAQLKRNGSPIPVNDIWIAATTFGSGGHLVTFDHHFQLIDELDCTIFSE